MSAPVQWTYDLRGLDALEWARRAGDDLAAQRAAGDDIVLLVDPVSGDAVAALRQALATAGLRMRAATISGVAALVPAPADLSAHPPGPDAEPE